MYNTTAAEMLSFIESSPTAYNACDNFCSMLDANGFTRISSYNEKLTSGEKYYITKNSSAVIAFIYREKFGLLAMASAHDDSPCLRLKPNCITATENSVTRLNCEPYGGMIEYSWLDRALSVAGRVVYDDDGVTREKSVNIRKNLALIPSVAIHMNRKVNESFSVNAQTDLSAVVAEKMTEESFNAFISENCGINSKDILAKELFLYPKTPGFFWGAEDEFISAFRLDDMMCAYGIIKALCESKEANDDILPLAAVFDNEEVGSATKQGADSQFLNEVIALIARNCQKNTSEIISKSFMVSADNAHAVHPNHPEYSDITNRSYPNGGIVIKRAGNQKYATDAVSEGKFVSLLKRCSVPYQYFANRSDMAGGSTLGSISSTHAGSETVDIGLAMYAMHSACETAGAGDEELFIKAMKEYFCCGVK